MLLVNKVIDYAKDDLSIDKLIRSKYKTEGRMIHYGLPVCSLILAIASFIASQHHKVAFAIPMVLWSGGMFLCATWFDDRKKKEVVKEHFKEYRLCPDTNRYYFQELRLIEFIKFVQENDIHESIIQKAAERLREKKAAARYPFKSGTIVIAFIGSYLGASFKSILKLVETPEALWAILLTTLPMVISIAFMMPFAEFSIFRIPHSTKSTRMEELLNLFEDSLIEIQRTRSRSATMPVSSA